MLYRSLWLSGLSIACLYFLSRASREHDCSSDCHWWIFNGYILCYWCSITSNPFDWLILSHQLTAVTNRSRSWHQDSLDLLIKAAPNCYTRSQAWRLRYFYHLLRVGPLLMTVSIFGLVQKSSPASYKFPLLFLLSAIFRFKHLHLLKFQRFKSHYWACFVFDNFWPILHLRPTKYHLSVDQLCEAPPIFT